METKIEMSLSEYIAEEYETKMGVALNSIVLEEIINQYESEV